MQTSTIATMAVIMTVVWGGFLLLLVTALRKEADKSGGRTGASGSDVAG